MREPFPTPPTKGSALWSWVWVVVVCWGRDLGPARGTNAYTYSIYSLSAPFKSKSWEVFPCSLMSDPIADVYIMSRSWEYCSVAWSGQA